MPDDRPWWRRPMRIAALQCASEDPAAVLQTWADADFNVEQLLHVMARGYHALFDPDAHAEVLARYCREAHERGIRIIVYLNTHILNADEAQAHPDWCAAEADGSPRVYYDTFRAVCINSAWADHLMAVTDALLDVPVDGIFSDGPGSPCFCRTCRARFREMFKREMPEVPPKGGTPAERVLLRDFELACQVALTRRHVETIKAKRPEVIYYGNAAVLGYGSEQLVPYQDLVGSEGGFMFYGPPKNVFLWKPSITAKVLEAVAEGRPTVVFEAGDQKSWSRYLHTASETTLMYAAAVANGASVWYGLHCPIEFFAHPGGRAARAMNALHKRHEDCFEDTRSLARVALVHSPTSRRWYTSSAGASDFYAGGTEGLAAGPGDVGRAFEGAAAMLYRSQIPFDVITEAAVERGDAPRYDVLILPTCACLSDLVCEALAAYVRAGGNLVATLDTSLYDDAGRRRNDFGLAEVLGVSFGGRAVAMRDFNYFALGAPHRVTEEIALELLPAPDTALAVRTTTAAELATFLEPSPGRYADLGGLATPAITLNAFGKGEALYLAGTFAEFYHRFETKESRALVRRFCLDRTEPLIEIEGAPASLEVAVRGKPGLILVHLLNYTGGMSRPIERVVPLTDLRVTLHGVSGVRSVRLLAAETDSTFDAAGNAVTFTVPRLAEYEVARIETE